MSHSRPSRRRAILQMRRRGTRVPRRHRRKSHAIRPIQTMLVFQSLTSLRANAPDPDGRRGSRCAISPPVSLDGVTLRGRPLPLVRPWRSKRCGAGSSRTLSGRTTHRAGRAPSVAGRLYSATRPAAFPE
jgi:hypothetical protein